MNGISFTYNKEKTLNVVLYIAGQLKRRDFHKIFKILYFADREYIANFGMPITGDRYVAMEAGPVPSKTYDIFKIVRGDSYVDDNEDLRAYFKVVDWMYIYPLKSADMRKISPNEKEILDKCLSVYGDLSYDEIKEKSHDIAWRSTARDFPISFENIAREAGLEGEELQYVADNAFLNGLIS